MAIENVGNMNKMLNSFNANEWTKSASIDKATTQPLNSELSVGNLGDASAANNKTFSQMLSDSMVEVNGLQDEANKAMQKLVSGQSKNIHETMLAVEKADIAFRTMNQVRLKVIEAYKEIMRMQM
ncbi:MAG: flagellar hook-basal body complex protein FliE [Bacteriovoracaceae bacterium]|jgi:flagellar hook-basal body complex protein FliE|nr:flagellar hook-basal body complex protein FliE [Bacteriovoracaceae bacterium]